jgi:hypothetical protein
MPGTGFTVLTSLAYSTPLVVVCIVGLIMAFTRSKNHPRASMFAIWGFVILIFNSLAMVVVQTWLFSARSTSMSLSQFSFMSSGLGIVRAGIFSVGLILLVAAIFSDRGAPRRNREPDRERDDLIDRPCPSPADVPSAGDAPDTGIRERRS